MVGTYRRAAPGAWKWLRTPLANSLRSALRVAKARPGRRCSSGRWPAAGIARPRAQPGGRAEAEALGSKSEPTASVGRARLCVAQRTARTGGQPS
jgi:hypothetical protein